MRRRPVLETERLILRPPNERDFHGFAAMMADAEHVQYIGGRQPASLAWRSLATMVGSWAMRGYGMFAVLEKDGGRWVGQLGPWKPHGWPGNEIGWALSPHASGKGYAMEAAVAAMDWAFDQLDWTEVIHCIDPRNERSIRLAERLGSTRIGPVECPAPYDKSESLAWGQTREQWRARRAA